LLPSSERALEIFRKPQIKLIKALFKPSVLGLRKYSLLGSGILTSTEIIEHVLARMCALVKTFLKLVSLGAETVRL
tara:strand:- start:43 stop:270 length:228 start_codon:yes stop_codon:yes gene_type:complete